MPDHFIRRGARLLPVLILAPGLSASVSFKNLKPKQPSLPTQVDGGFAEPSTKFKTEPKTLTPDEVRERVLALGAKETRDAAMTSLMSAAPKAELVALLSDGSLALRVGALEVLEELGGASTFDPWAPPGDEANAESLARWRAWADSASPSTPVLGVTSRLDEDRRLAYLRDILGDNDARARRAAEAYARDGDGSLVFLERYLNENPTLSPGLRARILAVQYRILLSTTAVPEPGRVAEALVFGDRDKLLGALEALRAGGRRVVPVLRDHLTHGEALVRESACDIILVCGGPEAFPLVETALREETDPNVVQGALRSIPKIKTESAYRFLARHIAGADEELALAALRATVNGARPDSPASNKALDDAVVVALASPSWRARAAALDYVAARRPQNSSAAVVKLLEDKDDFVRYSAMKAAAAMNLKPAMGVLREMFMKDASLAVPVFVAYGSNSGEKPDDAMIRKLMSSESEYKIGVANEVRSYPNLVPVGLLLAQDADDDVACAALGSFASSQGMHRLPEVGALLGRVLKSGSETRKLAVIRSLDLRVDNASVIEVEVPAGPTELDGLFDSFGDSTAPAAKVEKGDTLAAGLRALMSPGTDARLRVPVLLAHVKSGDPEVLSALLESYPTLDTASRVILAERLPASKAGFPLAQRLLQDPVDTVRAAAAEGMTSYESKGVYLPLLLDESVREGTELTAAQIYGYNFSSNVGSPALRSKLRDWVVVALTAPQAKSGTRALALIACADAGVAWEHPVAGRGTIASLAEEYTRSPQDTLRRAAWYARVKREKTLPAGWVASLADDASPKVRELLPAMATGSGGMWAHYFDDLSSGVGSDLYFHGGAATRSPEVIPTLRRLLESDPSPSVRNASAVALLGLGEAVDPDRFVNTGDAKDLEARAGAWVSSNYRNLKQAPPYFLELAVPHLYDDDAKAAVARRLAGGTKAEPLRLTVGDYVAEVAAREVRPVVAAPVAAEVATPETPAAVAEARPFVAVFFHKPGCRECARTREILAAMRERHPEMTVEEHNILVPASGLLNQVISSRLGVEPGNIGVAPSVFTRSGMLARDRVNTENLAALLERTSKASGDDAWRLPEQGALSEAQAAVDNRYAAITLWVVIIAGLVDGINPCAFATIIFFLSYLRIARRSSREMWLTGWAFILGVFIAYFSAGLVLHELIAQLDRFAWLQRGMNWVFGGLALVAAGLSVADAVRARRGRLDEMTLKLPKFLGDRVRKTIREGAKARAFVPAAFVTGITVSVIELACTGQVYAPIVYKIRQGDSGAVGMLLVYNLAFILPLVALFIATWFGMKNDALLNFQKKHTFAVKLALAAVFLVLAGVILTGV